MTERHLHVAPIPPGLDGIDAADALVRSAYRPGSGDRMWTVTGDKMRPVLEAARRHRPTFCPHAMTTPATEGGPWVIDIDRRVVGCYDCMAQLTTDGTGPLAGTEPLPEDECAFCGARGIIVFASFTTRIDRVVIVGNRCGPCADAHHRALES